MSLVKDYHPGAREFFEPSAATVSRLVAAVSERAALACRVSRLARRDGDTPWVVCRKKSGLTQALFLVCFCRKFGYLPHMDAEDEESKKKEDKEVWDALYEFERAILVSA